MATRCQLFVYFGSFYPQVLLGIRKIILRVSPWRKDWEKHCYYLMGTGGGGGKSAGT